MGPATASAEMLGLRTPVDAEDDDRRLNPAADTEPSAQQDEHRGLAARILDLRKLVESHRQAHLKEHAHTQQRVAELQQLTSAMGARIDREVESIQRTQRELQSTLHEGGEQVRQAGQLARKIQDGMSELEELRATASDPHEVIKPLQRSLATLRGDLEALGRTIDIRFEQMPKGRAQSVESRGEDEDALIKMGAEVRKLRERVKALEPD